MKKGICLLLCVCMLVSCGITSVFAAEKETVLFSDDFESYNDGQLLVVSKTDVNAWSVQSNSSTSKIAAYKDTTGMVMRVTNTGATKASSPNFRKSLTLEPLTNLTISFRTKSEGAGVTVSAKMADGTVTLVSGTREQDWTSYKIALNLKDKRCTVFKDGEQASSKGLNYTDFSEVQIHFASNSIQDGQAALIDDIVLSTTDKATINELVDVSTPISADQAMKPFEKVQAPALSVPKGKYGVFTYDGSLNAKNNLPTGTETSFTSVTKNMALPGLLDKQHVIRFTNDSSIAKKVYVQKKITIGETPDEVTVAYYANLSKSGVGFTFSNTASKPKVIAKTKEWITAEAATGWALIEATLDFGRQTLTTYCNGKRMEVAEFSEKEPTDFFDITVSFDAKVAPADTMLLDNLVIYLSKTPDYGDIKYFGTTGTNWAKIGEPLTKDSYMANLREHPRLFVNDREALVQKIQTIDKCTVWYEKTKASADKILKVPPQIYEYTNGRNILNAARTIERRLMELGFVYMVEQDKKYVERGLAEIRNAGTFPDWSNNAAPMIPSELMYGIACFYDWTYDALTEEERLEIIEIVKRQALWQFVRAYDGTVPEGDIAGGTSNRAMLANTCAAGVAIAFADEEPALAEVLFKGALVYGVPPVEAFGEDGGFPEGASYWNLATEFMIYLTAQCETAFVEGYEMPEELAWYYDNPMIRNTGDYWLYTAGPKSIFNFGDANEGLPTDQTLYWLAKKYDKPEYNWAMAKRMGISGNDAEYPYFAIIYYDPEMPASMDGVALDKTFDVKDDSQVANFRSSWTDENALYAGLQGGFNNAGHMNKSLGTFVIDANGERFVRTPGRLGSGTEDASMYYGRRAEGQNTLIANPGLAFDQVPSAVARFIRHGEAENEAFSILDMTQTNGEFVSAQRGMFMTKGRRSIVLQDEVTMKRPSELWWFAHTDGDITLSADKKSAMITVNGERMYAAIAQGPADATFEIMQAKPLPTSPTPLDQKLLNIFKLAIHMQNVTETKLTVEFVPLKSGEAAPEVLTPVLPLASWSVSDNTIPTARRAGDTVALFLNSPAVLDKGNRTYVDTANMDVYPFTENGRTLVPVRFISESFDAKVGWDDATQTVTVEKDSTSIRLQIGSDKMYVNGEERILDVPANTYNGRTLIPLRALVEALGKQVMWDDRGLIVISDTVPEYTEELKADIISMLSDRVLLNGAEMTAFTTDKTDYYMITDGNIPTVTLTNGAPVAQNGNVATFNIGAKTYTITFVADKFLGQAGTKSGETVVELKLATKEKPQGPDHITWQPVKDVVFGVENEKYPPEGTIDNVIVQELTTNLHHRWTGNVDAWVRYEFEEPIKLHAFGLAGLFGDERVYNFVGEVSMDGVNWTQVLEASTSGTTLMPDIFALNGVEAKYFRLIAKGGSAGTTSSYTEVRFYTSAAQMEEDKSYWPVYFAQSDASDVAGATAQIVTKGVSANGAEFDLAGAVFTSADPDIATVDANGLVTFVNQGKTTITVTYNNGYGDVTGKFTVECF